jgi:hypothetical protein
MAAPIQRPLALLAALLLAACATGSIYHPASSLRGVGYSEQKLETNRWRVSFTGDTATPAAVVQDYALLRAAELTLSLGDEWFTVAGRATVPQDSGYGPSFFAGGLGPPCGIFGCRAALYGGFWYDENDEHRLSASLDIVVGKGPKPNDANTYDARDVANTIKAAPKAAS